MVQTPYRDGDRADGNLLTYNGWTFTWNGENRLATATNGTVTLSFSYDYMGRRIAKAIAGGATFAYTYDGWNLLRERKTVGGTSATKDFIWGLDLSQTLQGAGGVGGLLSVILPGETPLETFAVYDANGNVTEYVNASGATVAHYEYDPFGGISRLTGALADEFPHRFSTKYLYSETGLVYYGYRYYSPELGRWLSRDPIGEIGGFNLYTAFDNSPIDTIDLLGMASVVFTGNASVDLVVGFEHGLTKAFDVPYGAAIWYEPKKGACGFEWKEVFWIDDVYPTSGSLMTGLKPDDLLIVKAYKKYDEVKGLIDLLQAIYGGSFKEIAKKAVGWDVTGEFSGVKYELDSLGGLRGPLYHKTGADGKEQVCTKVKVKFQATVSASVKLKTTIGLKIGPKKSFTGSKGYLSNKWVTTDPKEVCVPCVCPEEDSTTKSGGSIP